MNITDNAKTVLERRYLIKDKSGKTVETVEQLFRRVANAIAAPDKNYDKNADVKALSDSFYSMMSELEFLPNSPTLMNAGRELGQLSACFVLPVEDSMSEIFEAIKQAALIHQSGGGTGFSFSRLRPAGSMVRSTGGVASGPISFMKVFNMATEAVKQGGTRRGANMGILRVDHPDILEFISCKQDTSDVTNFNISVGITENFMRAVEEGADYALINPSTKKETGTLPARDVFNTIVEHAWKNGEPGIVFLDRLNRDNVVPAEGEIESTNPCGEQPLLPYESCNLGSINLIKMLKDDDFDWDKLQATVETAVHFLDNVIDANKYPLEKIDETTKKTRKIGLGIMGWADSLLKLKIPYNSDEAVALAAKLMSFITETGRKASEKLAETRGSFPLFDASTYKNGNPLRNATVTTIAPTGTLSIIANVSSGVEPVFAYAYIRNIMDGTKLIESNPILKAELVNRGLYSEALMQKIAEHGTLSDIDEIPGDIKRVYVSSHDITPEWHIKMQAAFQRSTDNAVSKTVNFPSDATCEDVAKVFKLSYELDCKGVTIYRDGSRDEQVLNIANKKDSKMPIEASYKHNSVLPRSRPEITQGITERCEIGCGKLYITINYDEQGICEVFTNTGRHGGCPSQSEATSRLVTTALRSGVDVNYVIKQLKGIRCPSTIRQPGKKVTSCPDAIARAIEGVIKNRKNGNLNPFNSVLADSSEPLESNEKHTCPECGSKVMHEGGCVTCRECGYSKCN